MTPGKILGVLQATEPEVPALAGTAKQRRIYQYWLAEVAGEIVAVLGLKQRRHLYHLFVEPGFQRQGLGTRLWHQCCSDNSGELGVVTVHSSLGAVGFYQALGFRISGPPESLGGIPSVPLSWRPA